MTKMVIISLLLGEESDGSYHLSSPTVPGFHVVDVDCEKAYRKGLKILEETLQKRANEIGREVRLHTPMELAGFVPAVLKQHVEENHGFGKRPAHLIAEIM